MRLTNCAICGSAYMRMQRDICPDCVKLENEYVITVRRFLKEHPSLTIIEISKLTGIDKRFINRFVREGRLDITIKCRKCGETMKSNSGDSHCSICKQLVIKGIMSGMERMQMENKIKDDKIKELQQKQQNNSLRKSLYGLSRGDKPLENYKDSV